MRKILFLSCLFCGLCFAEFSENLAQNLANSTLNSNFESIKSSSISGDENFLLNEANSSIKSKQEPKKLEFSITSLYQNSDIVVQIVIWILVLFSILTWAVFFAKIFLYNGLFKALSKDKDLIKNLKEIDFSLKFSAIAQNLIIQIKDECDKSLKIDENIKERIKLRLECESLGHISRAKALASLLASVGSSAPFIGLFGTVWGIMNAFIGISQQESVSLAVVAPHIAEALFATAFGLAAAIPAVLFYNYLMRLGANFAQKLDENATMLYVIAIRALFKENK